jgi:hypothetical protein
MLGAGTIINPIIKIVTTVAILAAVYFFIVKPIGDTTSNAFDAFDDIPGASDLSSDIQDHINSILDANDSDRLRACIKHAIAAGGSEQAIDRCVDRFDG